MNKAVPPVAEIRSLLESLSHAQLQRLAKLSEVPFTTLWKIRDGTTKNPGIATVALFLPHVDVVRANVPSSEVHDSAPAPLVGEGA